MVEGKGKICHSPDPLTQSKLQRLLDRDLGLVPCHSLYFILFGGGGKVRGGERKRKREKQSLPEGMSVQNRVQHGEQSLGVTITSPHELLWGPAEHACHLAPPQR